MLATVTAILYHPSPELFSLVAFSWPAATTEPSYFFHGRADCGR